MKNEPKVNLLDVLKDAGGEGTLTLSDAAVGRKMPNLWLGKEFTCPLMLFPPILC